MRALTHSPFAHTRAVLVPNISRAICAGGVLLVFKNEADVVLQGWLDVYGANNKTRIRVIECDVPDIQPVADALYDEAARCYVAAISEPAVDGRCLFSAKRADRREALSPFLFVRKRNIPGDAALSATVNGENAVATYHAWLMG